MASTAPSVKATVIPASLLKFPPSSVPTTLPPPLLEKSFEHPFRISTATYNAFLDVSVPITIALVYATVVTYLNNVNADRKHKPWVISKTTAFHALVIAHNVFLAVFSGWVFLGMVNAIHQSWPGIRGPHGLAGAVDALCKINGPRGLGDAATYNESSSAWGFTNRALHLAADRLTPSSADVGRIWNEGLAFYGWIFYISKFYEVIDTLIILAKGKKSSFLQTYHHAGAMMCMWAGIRYMSPPIWMFVTVNSFLHTLMYSYYTTTALGIKVPIAFKKVLTTLQIVQFVFGATYAFSHLFIAYQMPVSVPYAYHLGEAVSSMASSVASDASSAFSVATATASAGVAAWVKKAAFRAAGREGLAENVVNNQGQAFGIDAVHAAKDLKAREETRYRDELQWVNCLDTSGQVFAILLNCMYLAPLTFLFVRFFVKAYTQRQQKRRSSSVTIMAHDGYEASVDAARGVYRQATDALDEANDVAVLDDIDPEADKMIAEKIHDATSSTIGRGKRGVGKIQDVAKQVTDDPQGAMNAAAGKAQDTVNKLTDATSKTAGKAKKVGQKGANKANEKVGDIKKAAGKKRDEQNVDQGEAADQLHELADRVKKPAEDGKPDDKDGESPATDNQPLEEITGADTKDDDSAEKDGELVEKEDGPTEKEGELVGKEDGVAERENEPVETEDASTEKDGELVEKEDASAEKEAELVQKEE